MIYDLVNQQRCPIFREARCDLTVWYLPQADCTTSRRCHIHSSMHSGCLRLLVENVKESTWAVTCSFSTFVMSGLSVPRRRIGHTPETGRRARDWRSPGFLSLPRIGRRRPDVDSFWKGTRRSLEVSLQERTRASNSEPTEQSASCFPRGRCATTSDRIACSGRCIADSHTVCRKGWNRCCEVKVLT